MKGRFPAVGNHAFNAVKKSKPLDIRDQMTHILSMYFKSILVNKNTSHPISI